MRETYASPYTSAEYDRVLASPEIIAPLYTPEDKVRIFLVADKDTEAHMHYVQEVLRTRYGEPKLRRIYDEITGIPVVTLSDEIGLRRLAQHGNKGVSTHPDFLRSLAQSVTTNAAPEEGIVFTGAQADWAQADRTSMLITRFQGGGHSQTFQTVKNEILRNLQEYLLGFNSRKTGPIVDSPSIDWVHQPAPYIPLARPSRALSRHEQQEIRDEVASVLPQEMRFYPYVATPQPLTHYELDDPVEEEPYTYTERTPSELGNAALTLVERALRVKDHHPDALVTLYDKAADTPIEVTPEASPEHFREGTGEYFLTIRY